MPAEDTSKTPRPFDVRTIKALVTLMNQHNLYELDLREGPRRIRLTRSAPGSPAPPGAAPAAQPQALPAGTPDSAKPAEEKNTVSIKSPTPGTFYTGPDPESPAFVKVGSRVTPDTVVCIIEAMKIFNEIHAECTGVITKILVGNAQPVEYGQALFEVDPTA